MSKIINSLVFRLKSSIKKKLNVRSVEKQFGKVDKDIFLYPDCLVTVQTICKFYKAKRLCDIGAYKGRWSYVMHQLNPSLETVVMFEPQAKLMENLNEHPFTGVKKKIYQCALGEKDEQLTIRGGTASASLYEVSKNQNHFYPGSTTDESELVEVKILDEIYETNKLELPDLIKMDVQGYELNVLKGSKNVLENARYLVIELGLLEFYKGQPSLWELLKYLEESQYVMVDRGYELRSRKSPFELLQFDAIFMNQRFS